MRFVLIFTPIIIAAIGQLILKTGMNQIGELFFKKTDILGNFIKIFSNPMVILGLFFYFSSALVWLVVLSKEKLSFVYPLVAASYVITVFLSKVILKENVPTLRWLGLTVIVVGILMIAKSSA